MRAAQKGSSEACISLNLPAELRDAIEAKARMFSATLDETIQVLLRSGLAAQNLRESKIEALAEHLLSAEESESESHGTRLGQTIFGI